MPFSDEISAISVNLPHQSQSNLEQCHWLHQPPVQSELMALNAGFSQEVAWIYLTETISELHQVTTGFFSKFYFEFIPALTATSDGRYINLLQYIVKKV